MKKSLLIAATFLTILLQAQETKTPIPQITVTGEGKIKVTPDKAIISIGVQNTGKDAKEVKTMNDETVDKIIKFLKKSGIDNKDYQTTNVSLHKSYDFEKKKHNYQANQNISITLKDLSKYDAIMMGLNDAGVNNISGVEFKSSKLEEFESDARKKAMLNAKAKANDYVSVLNQKVGKAISITDSSQVYFPQPMYKSMNVSAMADGSAPERETLAIGEIEVNATVTVSFQID
jgi:uncharacterized protein